MYDHKQEVKMEKVNKSTNSISNWLYVAFGFDTFEN